MIRSILEGSLLALFLMSPLLSQILPELGARVRIATGAERLTGTLIAINADELTITSRSGESRVAISEVTRIEVSKGNYAGRGALYGFLGGAAFGAVLGAVSGEADCTGVGVFFKNCHCGDSGRTV